MAFGAENISWGCYTAGWFHNQVLDEDDEKTEQYDKLKTVNREIHTIAEVYFDYRRTATHFVGFAGSEWLEGVKQETKETLNTGVFLDVHAKENTPLVIDQMVSKNSDGSYGLMVAAADDHYDNDEKDVTVVFKANGRRISAVGGNGYIPVSKNEDGYYEIKIRSNAGVFITAR